MKKLLVILFLLGAFVNPSEAKIQAGIGVKVGPGFGRWNNEYKTGKLQTAGGTLGFQTGIHAGLQARLWFNKFVGLNLGAEFNMNGNRFTRIAGSPALTTIKTTHKENQLTVPLTAMVGWGNERLRIFANLGGYFGYNINGKDVVDIDNNGSKLPSSSEKADYKENYNSMDAGVRLGAGFQVYVDKKLKSCVTFDINYDYGFIKTFRNGVPTGLEYGDASKFKFTPSKMMIGVGYMYTFGKSQSEEKPKRVMAEDEQQ